MNSVAKLFTCPWKEILGLEAELGARLGDPAFKMLTPLT
jgi:hypothetical protein